MQLPGQSAFLGWITGLSVGWLAFVFAKTLTGGRVPLIQQVALVSDPSLPPALRRYTRLLTALWCGYLCAVAVLSILLAQLCTAVGLIGGVGSIVLFIGEHRIRPLLFRGHRFPTLRQQFSDTISVWRRSG